MARRMGRSARGVGRIVFICTCIGLAGPMLPAAPPRPSLPGILGPIAEFVPWQKLFADQDWYKQGPPQERILRGKLEAVAQPEGPSSLMRTYYYRLRQWNIYTEGKRIPLLEQFVGKEVEILGKEVKMALEGQELLEFWPGAIRQAMPHPKWPKLPGTPPAVSPGTPIEPARPGQVPGPQPKTPPGKPAEPSPKEAKFPAEKPAKPAWQKLFADQDWYQQTPGKEQIFRGRLESIPQKPVIGFLMRSAFYRLGDRTIYTGAQKPKALEHLVGQEVEILGKAVDMALEGQVVREIWPAAVRPAPAKTPSPKSLPQSKESRRRPNVLFIAVDDLRPQLGCYGDKLVRSPNIDRLAERGTVFLRAYCQQALCSPSRISLLTGRHCWTTQIYQIGPPLRSKMPDVITLPQLFKNHGYFTRSLGKVFHIGIDDPASWSTPSWISKKPRYGPEGMAMVRKRAEWYRSQGLQAPKKGPEAPFYAGPAFEAPDCADEDLADGDMTREAIAALRQLASKPNPFFLAIGFLNPHVPWVAPKRYFDLYDPAEILLPENRYPPKGAPSYAATSGADFYWYGNVPKDRKITPEFGRQCLHGYLAAISYVDACIGRVLDELDRLQLADNTIVVLWGDHGYYMGEHGWWGGKHNNYEGATRAPLIIVAPGQKAPGKKTDAIVEFVDIYPTLAELAGLPLPEGLEGNSLVPLLNDPTAPWDKTAISEYPKAGRMGTALRTRRYRYVEWRDKTGRLVDQELYDHQIDPQENENLAGRPEYAQVLQQLEALLRSARASRKAPLEPRGLSE